MIFSEEPKNSSSDHEDEFLWGSYKSNLYFGMKNRVPLKSKSQSKNTKRLYEKSKSSGVEFSIGWFDGNSPGASWDGLRHTAEQNQLRSYSWKKHDGRTFGVQEFIDEELSINLTVSFLKFFPSHFESSEGVSELGKKYTLPVSDQCWSVHVSVEPLDSRMKTYSKEKVTSLLLYFVNTDLESGTLKIPSGKKKKGLTDNPILIQGETQSLGEFEFYVVESESNVAPQYTELQTRIMKNLLPDLTNTHFLGENLGRSSTSSKSNINNQQKINSELFEIENRGKRHLYNKLNSELRPILFNARESGLDQFNTLILPTLPNSVDQSSNTLILQKSRIPPFHVDIIYIPKEIGTKEGQPLSKTMKQALIEKLSSSFYFNELSRRTYHFVNTLFNIFPIPPLSTFNPNFPNNNNNNNNNENNEFGLGINELVGRDDSSNEEMFKEFVIAAVSNLLGGIGYFEGKGLISKSGQVLESDWSELFSAVPSRAFFPRGFLWDEGFHQSLIYHWDSQITMDVLQHWYNLMFPSGWIPREQILGPEARSRVPQEFQVQSDNIGNPPTFILVIEKIFNFVQFCKQRDEQIITSYDNHIQQEEVFNYKTTTQQSSSSSSSKEDTNDNSDEESMIHQRLDQKCSQETSFLIEIFPKLCTHIDWIIKTMAAKRPYTFRWKDRKGNHTLSSGFDDYPRFDSNLKNQVPYQEEEHVDLLSWILFSIKTLKKISELVKDENSQTHPSITSYNTLIEKLSQKLEQEYWDDEFEFYTDIHHYTSDSQRVHVRHQGYVGVLPLALGLIDKNSPHLPKILSSLQHTRLMSEYGVRSLSSDDPLYETGENYWRGSIWININYLILSSLKKNYMTPDSPVKLPASIIYHRLRTSIIRTVYHEWKRTGLFFEQYKPTNGHGKGVKPFTGWTTLIVNIISEKY